jgi:hypothetical protein
MSRTITDIRIELVPDEYADTSWLDQTDAQMGEGFEAHANERKRLLETGAIGMIGVRIAADVEIFVPNGNTPDTEEGNCIGVTTTYTLTTAGVWSIESDSGDDYFREIAADQLDDLRDILRADDFGDVEIAEVTSRPIPITPA